METPFHLLIPHYALKFKCVFAEPPVWNLLISYTQLVNLRLAGLPHRKSVSDPVPKLRQTCDMSCANVLVVLCVEE